MPNHLQYETSPYLLQHANNPVDWYPWGEKALTRAKQENKPILLSIGYSACHWCHVMEKESFENHDIAQIMNTHFINIKVDREERPDLDQIYQNVAQLITHSGGWPLTVFLTPDLRPFFGGTYFPPDDRYGRPSFPRVLQSLAQAYKEDAKSIEHNASHLMSALKRLEQPELYDSQNEINATFFKKIAENLLSHMDWRNGGFGSHPKFPQPMNLTYLWRYGLLTGLGQAQEAVVFTLSQMAKGGIYDQLGGGFHRYSVDERWSVPHFEKMLYDNALLLQLYSEVILTAPHNTLHSKDEALFYQTIEETTEYILREMHHSTGGFFSTQDADSEGEEGKFFVWDPHSIRLHLNEDQARVFEQHYGVTTQGNFEHQQTVLYQALDLTDLALQLELPVEHVKDTLKKAKEILFQARSNRITPFRDEKILASWNGLMISGLAWASQALIKFNPTLAHKAINAAHSAMEFITKNMTQNTDRLLSVSKVGVQKGNAYLDDYAFLAMASVDLARFSDENIANLLSQAKQWMKVIEKYFTDDDNAGFFFTSSDHEELIQRPKSFYDQAIPSGNAVSIKLLSILGEIFPDTAWHNEAQNHIQKVYPLLEKSSMGLAELANTVLLHSVGPVFISGKNAHHLCTHPFVMQNYTSSEDLIICHRRSCTKADEDFNKIQSQILKLMQISNENA